MYEQKKEKVVIMS